MVMVSTRTAGRDGATLRVRGWDGSSLGSGALGGADPLGFAAGDANLYRYVGNDPTDLVDPSGLEDAAPIKIDPIKISPPSPPLPSCPIGGINIPNPGQVIIPTGGMMRNPTVFPEVTGACNALRGLSAKDSRERGTGVYINSSGGIKVGVPARGGIVTGNLIGGHDQIDLNPLGNSPKGWILIATIHSHPPDLDPTTKNPQNSRFDPTNSCGPVGNSPPVPWFVIDSDGKIYLIGPNIRNGAPNPIAR
jgi:hypothetical protein